MSTVLEVGVMVGPSQRIVQMRWVRSRRCWRATDSTGTRYYQRGPGHGTSGPQLAAGLDLWPDGLGLWPEPPEDAGPPRWLRPMSKAKRAEIAASRPVVEEVMERDGGCVLRTRTDEWGPCEGPLDPHHLRKAVHGGEYSLLNLVTLCRLHNCEVEDHPDAAKAFGLVVNGAISHAEAAYRRRARGLVVEALPVTAMGRFVAGSVALTVAVSWGLLALGGCGEGNTGQVCELPDAADCPSHSGGEPTP